MTKIVIHFDGGSRENPGPAGAGGVIAENGKIIKEYSRFLGNKTNNEAEYLAALLGIKVIKILNKKPDQLVLIGDSELVINQLAGRFKIKEDRLKKLYADVKQELSQLDCEIEFKHVKREKNKEADKLVNKAIDEEKNTK